jgi:hypothetical protein
MTPLIERAAVLFDTQICDHPDGTRFIAVGATDVVETGDQSVEIFTAGESPIPAQNLTSVYEIVKKYVPIGLRDR